MNNNYIFLSGMLRTGSNLLSSILNQNQAMYSEGISVMCNTLWDLDVSLSTENTKEELKAVNKNTNEKKRKMGIALFDSYYEKENKIIFDKNPSWTITSNILLLKKYIVDKPKIVVLTRNIEDIAKSYVNIFLQNGYSQESAEQAIFNFNSPGQRPFMRPLAGVMNSIMNKDLADFIHIDYDDLILNPEKTITDLYSFANVPFFKHTYSNIAIKHPENSDKVLKNIIHVRPEIAKRAIDVELSEKALTRIKEIQILIDQIKTNPTDKDVFDEFKEFYLFNTY